MDYANLTRVTETCSTLIIMNTPTNIPTLYFAAFGGHLLSWHELEATHALVDSCCTSVSVACVASPQASTFRFLAFLSSIVEHEKKIK